MSQQPLLPSQQSSVRAWDRASPSPHINNHEVGFPISEPSCLNVANVVKGLAAFVILALIAAAPGAAIAHHYDPSFSSDYTWVGIPISVVGGIIAYLWYRRSLERDAEPVQAGPFAVPGGNDALSKTAREVFEAQYRHCVDGRPIMGDAAAIGQKMDTLNATGIRSLGVVAEHMLGVVEMAIANNRDVIKRIISTCQSGGQHQPYEYREALMKGLSIPNEMTKEGVITVVMELIAQAHLEAFNRAFPHGNDIYAVQNRQWADVVCQQYGLRGGQVMQPFFNYNSATNQVELKFLYQYQKGGKTKYIPVHAVYSAHNKEAYAIKYPSCGTPEAARIVLARSQFQERV